MNVRAEITHREKATLGRLMGAYVEGGKALHLAPSDPDTARFEALTRRGGWVKRTNDGGYQITQYGMDAFYTAKVVRE